MVNIDLLRRFYALYAELFRVNLKYFFRFLWFLDTKMAQVLEILRHGTEGPVAGFETH